MMTSQHRQEALSLAYVTAVAGRAGVTFSLPSHDYGTDLWLHEVVEDDSERLQAGWGFRVQLKSTTCATVEPNAVVYDVDLRSYDMLRADRQLIPIVLIVYIMPSDEVDWFTQDETRLELWSCAYWISLHDYPATTNTTSIRIRIPRTNQFTPAALARIIDLVSQDKELK